MISTAQNDRLARVGPGTPGGELMRRYWVPIAAASQLSDDPVKKIRILGEDLVLYRNRKGKLGLIGERCPHRLVELQFGIPEDEGLRCPYHGWMYNEKGQCIERPMEKQPDASCAQIKIAGYPVEELGGLIFTYMGPLPAPLLPRWDILVWPNAIRQIGFNVLNCNWLQCHENTGDPAHSAYTHGRLFQYALEKEGKLEEREKDSNHTLHNRIRSGVGIKELYAHATEYGMEKGIIYSKELGAAADRKSRHSTVIFPFYSQVGFAGAPRCEMQMRIPIDDTHTLHICYGVYAAPPGVACPEQNEVPWYEAPTHDEKGKPILDYVLAQDMLCWWGQGDLVDRSKETLGRTDLPIVFLRKQLDEQITLVEQGKDPMNTFREPHDILYGGGTPAAGWVDQDWAKQQLVSKEREGYRSLYHKGYVNDDADRYGPMVPQIMDLHRRIEEAMIAAQQAAE